MNNIELCHYIDHTNLKSNATESDIMRLCEEAAQAQFAAVCINPVWVPFAHVALKETSVSLCSVVGFPLGASPTSIKLAEADFCLNNGANEIDMVINICEAKAGNWVYVESEIRALAKLCHDNDALLKVIFENCYLEKSEISKACVVSMDSGADYVKTSTGFGTGGASVADVRLMSDTVKGVCRVKAAGGIKDKETALKMIDAGADRIGTSSGLAII